MNTASERQARAPRRIRASDYPPVLFLAAAICLLPVESAPGALGSLAIVFISIVLEAVPFMFLGSLVGGLIEVFVSRERIASILPRRGWLTVCIAAGAGIAFPVCECAVVPVVRRLMKKGLPLPAAVGYLLGGPIFNPVVAASTALAYGFDGRVVFIRMVSGFGIAVAVGMAMGRIFRTGAALMEESPENETDSPHSCGCVHRSVGEDRSPWNNVAGKAASVLRHAAGDFLAVGHYLVIGAFIAALAQTAIDRSAFLKMAEAPVLSIVLMMALAICLNLCSEADAFIAASFRGLVPLPAQMAFLLAGPMFDLKLLMMYRSVFRRSSILILGTLILTAVLGVSVVLEWIAGALS